MFLIGLVGRNGSGKSTVAEFLGSQGFALLSLSDMVREEARRLGRPLDRDNLTQTGNEMKQSLGTAVLAERIYEAAVATGADRVCFDSIRHQDEVAYFVSKGVYMLGVELPLEERYRRIQERQSSTDQVTLEEFRRQDEREDSGKSFGQNIQACLDACGVVIKNNDTIATLHLRVTDYIRSKGVELHV